MRIVFDIGGTNMRVAGVKGDALGDEVKVETPANFQSGLSRLLEVIKKVPGNENVEELAGGMAGVITEGKIEFSPNLPGWLGADLGKELKEKVCPKVTIKNDADVAALGEATFGAGQGRSVVSYLGIGTGVGGGRIVGGKIDKGKYGFEPGHQIIDVTTGKTLEELVSGGAIEKKYGKTPQELPKGIVGELTSKLAVGIQNTILFWSPDVLVLGGSLVNEGDTYKLEDIVSELRKMPKVFPSLPEIKKAQLGNKAGLWGALALLQSS